MPAMTRLLRFVLLAFTISSLSLFAAQKTVVQEPLDAATPTPKEAPGKALIRSLRRIPQRNRMGLRPRPQDGIATPADAIPAGPPIESAMTKAGSAQLDLRFLPQVTLQQYSQRPERQLPPVTPTQIPGDLGPAPPTLPAFPTVNAPAPSPSASFAGLDSSWSDDLPPDANGDVGPAYYIQTINTAVGVYRKSDGVRVAAFTFNSLMSQGHFGNLCDTNNFGDPVVIYDSFEDRWIITDFAFQLNGFDIINPPGSFQCFAVSMSGDPVNGGWNFYSINTAGGMGDYPKFGIWPDGLYMTANMFDYLYFGPYLGPRMYAFNKAQMYAGKSSIQIVSFDAPSSDATILPANARLQAGTPPAGSPNYYAEVYNYTNAVSIYKFHVDWSRISLSSFTGPFNSTAPNSWAYAPSTVPALSGDGLDSIGDRLMAQNQYTNQGGVESLWMNHTVLGAAASTAAPRYYQVDVTGGTVAANTSQAFTYTPDSTMNRFMGSVAVDRAGDMALGYSTTSSSSYPAIKYAGRLATDPINSVPQTEVSLINGTGSQIGIDRWGDYSAMTLDPDGCRFWYTNEYYPTTTFNNNFLTRIGAFAFSSCTPVGSGGTLQGTVTAAAGGAPVSGVTAAFGARSATTDGSGVYSFAGIPAGTYPAVTVSKAGLVSQTAAPIVITDGGSTTKNFALSAAATSGCLTDTAQSDFQTGVPAAVDLITSPGNVTLATALTGNLVSGLKDSNPGAASMPVWSTLSWTAATPANTSVKFQVAGSNSDSGPFNFVGPDGTNATFFTATGSSLSQFSGLRYLEYKAYLATTTNGVKPTLSDVTLCYANADCSGATATITASSQVCANSTGNTASGPAGEASYLWSITTPGSGTITSGATSQTVTYSAGTGALLNLSLTTVDGAGCQATAGKSVFITSPTVTPASLSNGTVGAAFFQTFGASGGVPPNSFSLTGALPPNLQFSGGTLSGTPNTTGTYTFTVTTTDTNGCSGSRTYTLTIATPPGTPPARMTATAISTTQVILSWNPVASATSYDVIRTAPGGAPAVIGSTSSTVYGDTQGLVAGSTYIYVVRANGPGFPANAISLPDIATMVVFTDDPFIVGSTLFKGVHLTELRSAVNAVRAAAGLTAATFTDAAPAGRSAKALHIQELRAALDPARSAIGVPAMIYSNTASAGALVRAIDLAEIRNGVK